MSDEKYISFATEGLALKASHDGLVSVGEYRVESSTYYLCEVREGTDGLWYLIIPSHPSFDKYRTIELPPEMLANLTDIEPLWFEDIT